MQNRETPASLCPGPVRLSLRFFLCAAGLMLLCQIFFGLLQLSSLETQLRAGLFGIADTAAGTLAEDLSMGLRLGKRLRNFYNLRNLLQDAHRDFPMAHDICVTDGEGNLVEAMPGAGEGRAVAVSSATPFIDIDKGFLNHVPGQGPRLGAHNLYYAARPLLGRANALEGHVLIRLKASMLEERIMPAVAGVVRDILLSTAAMAAAALLIIRAVPFLPARGR